MSITRTPIWIRFIDLPLNFWSTQTLEAMRNSIGKFLKIDIDRAMLRLDTFAHICVEEDMNKGFPDKFFLKWINSKWMVQLDYENTTFCCGTCHQIGHIQDTFPLR